MGPSSSMTNPYQGFSQNQGTFECSDETGVLVTSVRRESSFDGQVVLMFSGTLSRVDIPQGRGWRFVFSNCRRRDCCAGEERGSRLIVHLFNDREIGGFSFVIYDPLNRESVFIFYLKNQQTFSFRYC
ncbi:hypothetical protein JTE90_011809 [Oedothorax gibbosus]|uniref:Uncharacterized protein n=1 Tax=Oedothorax gibbosus TaxID=931172 RepID=A0AAV6VTI3_9ARAC|nr:hypothetical protein JTE90_011809 [Oedothorax gibbosus]